MGGYYSDLSIDIAPISEFDMMAGHFITVDSEVLNK